MGSKPSTPGGDCTAQALRTEDIHAAYRRGDSGRARDLLREACDESTSQLERVGPGPHAPSAVPARVISLLASWSGSASFHVDICGPTSAAQTRPLLPGAWEGQVWGHGTLAQKRKLETLQWHARSLVCPFQLLGTLWVLSHSLLAVTWCYVQTFPCDETFL